MRPLPFIVNRHNKYRWGLVAFLFFVTLYAATNTMHSPALFVLVPGAVDDAIPLVPTSIWVYSSYLFISLAAYVLESNRDSLSRVV